MDEWLTIRALNVMAATVDILCFISPCINRDNELFTEKYTFNLETLILGPKFHK